MFKNIFAAFVLVISVLLLTLGITNTSTISHKISGAPTDGAAESEVPEDNSMYSLANWKRPEGPARVGVQIGHYKNDEVPEELERLKNNTGAQGGGVWEWEVNYEIAHLIADNLRGHGVEVDILPTTVPPDYIADVFIAIHADGSEDRYKSGYKFAGPWRDYTEKSKELVSLLEKRYEVETGLTKDENISRNMRGYYAFSWWKYEHSIHPMTTAVIAETGFITNWGDRELLTKTPEVSANAISDALLEYLENENFI
jgi:N-acetylmuramoyl-L-alanine amidase